MALVLKSDLNTHPEKSILSCDANDSGIIKKMIVDFVDDASDKLVGDVWKKCLYQLSSQNEFLDMQADVADDINLSIGVARKQMISFMDDYDKLDSGYLDEIHQSIIMIKKEIDDLSFRTNDYDKWNLIHNNNKSISVQINDLKAQYFELKKMCDKLEELDPTDNAIYGEILSSNKLNSYKNLIK